MCDSECTANYTKRCLLSQASQVGTVVQGSRPLRVLRPPLSTSGPHHRLPDARRPKPVSCQELSLGAAARPREYPYGLAASLILSPLGLSRFASNNRQGSVARWAAASVWEASPPAPARAVRCYRLARSPSPGCVISSPRVLAVRRRSLLRDPVVAAFLECPLELGVGGADCPVPVPVCLYSSGKRPGERVLGLFR
jgi:hypothetical protein